jgi:hypothetical protein
VEKEDKKSLKGVEEGEDELEHEHVTVDGQETKQP